jgi:hypothetical protein
VRENTELLLSDALARYVHHFRYGKRNPKQVNRVWTFVGRGDADLLQADMAAALAGGVGLGDALAARLPNPDFYRNLKKGYRRYLEIAERHGWEEIPAGINLRLGASDPRVRLIREHLRVLDGYDPGFVTEPERYDEGLAEAVRGFQRRSGLGADGVVGPNTLRALNQPLDERLTAIRANLERMRWLYNDLPEDYLFVDLTAYELYLVRAARRSGAPRASSAPPRTRPRCSATRWSTWSSTRPGPCRVPSRRSSRACRRATSGYAAAASTTSCSNPGPRNALGRVKFMFPNGHAIYLHDTPSRHLFSRRSRRAYSHGCVRVHKPLTLAEQVLNKPLGAGPRSIAWCVAATRSMSTCVVTAKADDEGRVAATSTRQALGGHGGYRRTIVFAEPPEGRGRARCLLPRTAFADDEGAGRHSDARRLTATGTAGPPERGG